MWIIPKNLKTKNSHIYHCAQDTEALTLDYSELSKMSEQSLLWRSKPSQSATWLRRWKTDLLNQHLFGRILKPSLGKCLMEKWTSCQVASLVSHSVQPVEEKGTKTQDTCFPTSRKEYENVDLPLFSWKMLKESCQANSKDKTGPTLNTHRFCYTSLESWKDWVTKQRRAYSQRVKQVHHINVNESSFLLSVMNSPNQALIMSPNLSQEASQEGRLTQQEGEESNIGMSRQGLRWATPNTMDCLTPKSEETLMKQATGVRKGRKSPSNLREQVDPIAMKVYQETNWTTPTASMKMREIGSSLEYFQRRMKRNKQIGLQGSITLDNQKFVGNLNPRWVEMLMGLPIGWTVPTCTNPVIIEPMNLECWGMEWCQAQQEPPSLQCGGNYPTPNARDWKDGMGTVPPSVNKTRGYSLGQAIAEDLNNKDLKLSEEYDNCILGTKDGLFVYSQSCIINVLYCEEESPEEQALIYAYEMFYHNIDCYQKNGPIIKEDLDHES